MSRSRLSGKVALRGISDKHVDTNRAALSEERQRSFGKSLIIEEVAGEDDVNRGRRSEQQIVMQSLDGHTVCLCVERNR